MRGGSAMLTAGLTTTSAQPLVAMFLLDDLLLAPARGLLAIARTVHDAARDELEGERDRLRDELNDLYMQLELGEISEATFDEREEVLLDRLDELDKLDEEVA